MRTTVIRNNLADRSVPDETANGIAAIIEIKRLNPRFGCPRIAQQISHAFGLEIDKGVVRRILVNPGVTPIRPDMLQIDDNYG